MSTLLNDSLTILQQVNFLRSDWFFAFIPLFIYLVFYLTKTNSKKNWQSVIDPQLQDFVLEKNNNRQQRYPVVLIFLAASLCITALAGPVYKKLPQPVYQEKSALIVLFDLSQSMDATDIKPSRLARAKLELLDILKTRKSGQTAFIVYAADAFVVTPLTDDNATIANLIPALDTNMMPAQGSNLSKAITKAYSLFTQAGVLHGNVLIITDDIHQRDENAIKKLFSQGHRVSIFGIGTKDGGPVPLGGSFLLDKQGAIVVPKLDSEKLQRFALAGGGLYASLAADESDTDKFTTLFQSSEINKKADNEAQNEDSSNNTNADLWREEGHWLLLPLLLLAALWTRKGWIAIVVLFILPLPQPAYAIDVQHLWSSPDQKAMRAFNDGNIDEAVKQFTNEDWKASALYKKGDYQAAADTLKETNSSDGYYNRGNALAKLGQYKDAIKAYDKAIDIDKNNTDAEYNREQVKQALKKQQNASKKDENKESSDKDGKEDKNQKDKSDKSDSEKKQDQDSDKQDKEDKQSKSGQSDDSIPDDSKSKSEKPKSDDNKSKNEDSSKEQQSKSGDEDNEDKQNQDDLKKRDAEKEAKKQQEEQEQYKQNQKEAQKEQVKNDTENKDEQPPEQIEVNPEEASISEAEKATKQWLKRIPDDPGGLLKRKFLYQYNQIPNQTDEQEPW